MFWIKKTPFLSQGYEEQIRWHIPRYEEEPPVNTAPIPSAAEAVVYFIQQFTPELLELSQVDSLGDVSSHKPTDSRTERNVKTHPQKKYRVRVLAKTSAVIHSTYIAFLFSLPLIIAITQLSVGELMKMSVPPTYSLKIKV